MSATTQCLGTPTYNRCMIMRMVLELEMYNVPTSDLSFITFLLSSFNLTGLYKDTPGLPAFKMLKDITTPKL